FLPQRNPAAPASQDTAAGDLPTDDSPIPGAGSRRALQFPAADEGSLRKSGEGREFQAAERMPFLFFVGCAPSRVLLYCYRRSSGSERSARFHWPRAATE